MPVDVKRVSRDTLYIALITTVTILAWIGFEVVRSLSRSQITPVTRQQLEPLPAGLNQEGLQSLKQRLVVDESEAGSLSLLKAAPAVTESGKNVSIKITPAPVATTGAGVLP